MIYHKEKLVFILGIMSCMVIPACFWNNKDQMPKTKQNGLVIINVLNTPLYEDCHIKGSINVPFESLESYISENIDKNAEIVLYCSNYMCAASGQACKLLKKCGFTNVWAYEG